MQTKLNYRLPQTADTNNLFQVGLEQELRERILLLSGSGIVFTQDVDSQSAPCAVFQSSGAASGFDISAGTVVFGNGEYVSVSSYDIQAYTINTAITDAQVVRLEYGEVEDGNITSNPYYTYAAKPYVRKKTPLEMLVVETEAAYNAQPQVVKDRSVVLGVVRWNGASLSIDNTRDTYSFSRPWFSVEDVQHRSQVGTGVVTETNPHATSANDLTVGAYTVWQALVGQPACVVARPVNLGRIPGEVCSETIPAGSFLTDTSGAITGKSNSKYAYLGFWPERLLSAVLASNNNINLAAWIPKTKNIIAIFDPAYFNTNQNVLVYYSKVTAGSLPNSLTQPAELTMQQPTSDEALVAGGLVLTELSEPTVKFNDVGLVPMMFDVMVGADGKVYKLPDVIYANTKLDSIGAVPSAVTAQPKKPTQLRLAISNFNPGFTEVRFQISGTDESSNLVTEQISFTNLPGVNPQYSERFDIRKFTANTYKTVSTIQAIVRNNDGPNTTFTLFAEDTPDRLGDDLRLASTIWTGTEVFNNNQLSNNAMLDRRIITRGGGYHGLTPVGSVSANAMSSLDNISANPNQNWATLVEDFNDPSYIKYPRNEDITSGTTRPRNFPGNNVAARFGYFSRIIPFAQSLDMNNLDALWVKMIPKDGTRFPAAGTYGFTVTLTLYCTDTTSLTYTGSFATSFPPFYLVFTPAIVPQAKSIYGASIFIDQNTDINELFQGYILHARTN